LQGQSANVTDYCAIPSQPSDFADGRTRFDGGGGVEEEVGPTKLTAPFSRPSPGPIILEQQTKQSTIIAIRTRGRPCSQATCMASHPFDSSRKKDV